MSLEILSVDFGWPGRDAVFNPHGAGARALSSLVKEKIQRSLSRVADDEVKVGLLFSDSNSASTTAPLGIVCEFGKPATENALSMAHSLAWNFSRSPLLVTVDPGTVRAFSCCEVPFSKLPALFPEAEIVSARIDIPDLKESQARKAAQSLHWANLVTGAFFIQHAQRFSVRGRADQTLLSNLRSIRKLLSTKGLSYPVIHDLLARIIFIQFLFHRTDSSGKAALNAAFLKKLQADGILSKLHSTLSDILRNYEDAYSFFEYLNDRFNGDLFPRRNDSHNQAGWHREKQEVSADHLHMLAEFVSGDMILETGQRALFPLYSFDVIPLEFISSVYEEFVSAEDEPVATHYTPAHLVDLILDAVLPWESHNWDLRILDPACGSGIFLVKSYQRLIHRWKQCHPGEDISPSDLRSLLDNNIFGIDVNREAVRVASFSLYLAMCDEIDPKFYWTRVRFPALWNKQLKAADFFSTEFDSWSNHFDLIIGNAPWGQGTLSEEGRSWSLVRDWPTPYNSIGPLFLPRALSLAKDSAKVAMLQPINTIISNVPTGHRFRKKIFSSFRVKEVINLSALRFGLFEKAVAPACAFIVSPQPPNGSFINYVCPKPNHNALDDYRINIDPHDTSALSPQEAAEETVIWTALMWGGRRDLKFIKRLSTYPNIGGLESKGKIVSSEGLIRGNRQTKIPALTEKRLLESITQDLGLFLSADQLPVNEDPGFERAREDRLAAFSVPQLIIRQAWRQSSGRFEAALVRGVDTGVLCSQSFLSIHQQTQSESWLNAALLVYNSMLAVYFLLLTSGRFASYRPEPSVGDFRRVPLPVRPPNSIDEISYIQEVDEIVRSLFELHDVEWELVEDLFKYTLPDFKGDQLSPGRQRTARTNEQPRNDLLRYCERLISVIRSAIQGSQCSATIFEDASARLPLRMIAIHLDEEDTIKWVPIEFDDLWDLLIKLNELFVLQPNTTGNIFRTRVVRVYSTLKKGRKVKPVVYIIKPDQVRYWTLSMAMRDADELIADIVSGAGEWFEKVAAIHNES